ncbi:hypothetical protein B6N60_03340 [Richelia sinica FACHB-800]|uniref:Uncharacterized protein n=1 Tax=Richelia sinica FACHB-800 TaxID=1357546 RepID=A0A975T9L6_9NOST|nr:hypothetical protein B6N60_03340 [Richelia sinica FACHB-800]
MAKENWYSQEYLSVPKALIYFTTEQHKKFIIFTVKANLPKPKI